MVESRHPLRLAKHTFRISRELPEYMTCYLTSPPLIADSCKTSYSNCFPRASRISPFAMTSSMSLQCFTVSYFLARACASSLKDSFTLSKEFSVVLPGDFFISSIKFPFCEHLTLSPRSINFGSDLTFLRIFFFRGYDRFGP